MVDKIKKLFNTKISSKNLYRIALCAFIVSLIPLVVIAFYNFPSADDYSFTIDIYKALNSDGLLGFIKAIFDNVKHFYFNWQGTFTAITIMSMQPSLFGVEWYFLTTFILLGFFIWGTFYLCKVICNDYLKLDKYYYKIIAILILTVCIQGLPSLVQGFYWWNGAIYYTLFFSFSLFQIGHILKYLKYGKRKNYILALILTFMVAGSNYVTVSNQVIMMSILLIYLFVKKHPKRYQMLGLLGVLYITAGFNMLAPGNSVRQSQNTNMGLFSAIFTSIEAFTGNVVGWCNFYNLAYILAVVLLLSKSYEKVNISFKHPFAITILICGILSALYIAPLYAMSNTGAGRLLNIIYYSYIWGFIILIYYWVGYFRSVLFTDKKLKKVENDFSTILFNKGNVFLGMFVLVNVMWIFGYHDNVSSYVAFRSIKNGEAAQYKTEMNERYDLYLDKDVDVVKVKPLTVRPKAIFSSDITVNPDYWVNDAVRQYFGKKKVYVEE